MNTLKIGLTSVILGASLLYGADSMDAQIKAIQNASPQERAELMNNLKTQIASMNEEGRANAISTLRKEMNGKPMTQGAPSVAQRMQSMQQMQTIQQGAVTQRIGDTLSTPPQLMRHAPTMVPIMAPTTAPIMAPTVQRR